MKSVLISIQPKWCELIALGKKTLVVQKTKPKIKVPFKVYIYETNLKDNTYWEIYHKGRLGKVIGEFMCDRIVRGGNGAYVEALLKARIDLGVPLGELLVYLEGNEYGCGWRISDLVIYDKPRELSDFIKPCNTHFRCDTCKAFVELFGCGRTILRPPQSWCYVEAQE